MCTLGQHKATTNKFENQPLFWSNSQTNSIYKFLQKNNFFINAKRGHEVLYGIEPIPHKYSLHKLYVYKI